jgi:hypothetical protein
LHYGHGVGYPELADSFGIAQGAVRMRMSRALAKMRDVLRSDDELFDLEAEAAVARSASRDDFAWDADESADEAAAPAATLFPAIYDAPTPRLLAKLEALVPR